MAEWRECAFGGEPDGGYGEYRWCPVGHGQTVWTSGCASCPVPALVEAVRAAEEFLASDVVQAAFVLQGVHGGCEPWRKDGRGIGEILSAALALLPKQEAPAE